MASTNPFENPPASQSDQQPQQQPQPPSTDQPPKSALQVDFSLKKWKVQISSLSTTTSSSSSNPTLQPLYRIDTQSTRTPQMLFRRANDPTSTPPFATGTLHTFNINPDYSLHGHQGTLTATKRFRTSYTYQSRAFARTPGGDTETMTWTSSSGLTNWDFILLDGDMLPVARFSSRVWAVRQWGKIEFLGERAEEDAAREEVVVTAMVLFFCMVVRSSSIFSLVGACFYRPGVHVKKLEGREQ